MSDPVVTISSKEQLDELLKAERVVVAFFYAENHEPSSAVAPDFEVIATSASRRGLVSFAKVDNAKLPAVSSQYKIGTLPTFILFRDGKVADTVQGSNRRELHAVLMRLLSEVKQVAGAGSSSGEASGASWMGAEVPRGYSDITDQVEIRGCELLNADEDAGPVKVLFETSKPSALSEGNSFPKDWVQSGSDDQLLLFIPFQSTIKLHTLQLTSAPPSDADDAPSRPGVVHLYINRPQNIDFDEAEELEPTQAITLAAKDWNADGTANIPLRYVKFQKTTSLIIFVQQGDGEAETVRLDRVKLIGDAGAKREMGKLQKVGEDEE